MRHVLGIAAAIGVGLAASSVSAADLVIVNNTQTSIRDLHLSPVSLGRWGPDYLARRRNDTLETGESLTLAGVAPGRYDIKLVNDRATHCVLQNVSLFAARAWELEEGALLGACPGFGR